MVFFITTAMLIVYGFNFLIFSYLAINSPDTAKRRNAAFSVLFTILGACGVLYLAAH
jgi:hypothetical protein